MIPMDKECPFTSIIRNTKNIAKTVPTLKQPIPPEGQF